MRQGGHPLVLCFTKANRFIVLNAALPQRVAEYSKQFAGMAISSVIVLFSWYHHGNLAEAIRNITAIQTPVGLLHFTRMVQGGTNSVQAIQRINSNSQHDNIPNCYRVFLYDVSIQVSTTRYWDVQVYPGIR
jgi:hypothetical protein